MGFTAELLLYSFSVIFLLLSIVGLVWAIRLRTQLVVVQQQLNHVQAQAERSQGELATLLNTYAALQLEQQQLVARAA
ncbi:MAG TPA: hypothetical protein PK129_10860, partial [Cellvibrionaceae bacterium]|nr:hypothetical protein [Cellvibrionaceae bacterium]